MLRQDFSQVPAWPLPSEKGTKQPERAHLELTQKELEKITDDDRILRFGYVGRIADVVI